MFISKKKVNEIEKRIADLESKQTTFTFSYGEVDLQKLAKIFERSLSKSTIQ